jgi:hypothetical protein
MISLTIKASIQNLTHLQYLRNNEETVIDNTILHMYGLFNFAGVFIDYISYVFE